MIVITDRLLKGRSGHGFMWQAITRGWVYPVIMGKKEVEEGMLGDLQGLKELLVSKSLS